MNSTQHATGHIAPAAANPIIALTQLGNVLGAMDRFIQQPHPDPDRMKLNRRLAYARNSLCVGFELWQNDLERRLLKSRSDFYIFSMTDEEATAFRRRVVPGMNFTAEDLKKILEEFPAFAPQAHLAAMVEKIAEDARIYAENNKNCLETALESGMPFSPLHITAIALPADRP